MTEFRTLLSNFVKKSQTNGLLKNDGTVDTTSYISTSNTQGLLKNDGTVDTTSYISTSNTQGLLKNDGTVDTTNYLSTHQDITDKEDKSNKVTSISSSSTDTQYPSAKLLYDTTNQLENSIVDMIYPIGSIYMSVNSTSPQTLFGGTWEQIKDTFLLATGDTYANGSTGGEATHKLTVNEMPSHTHTQNSHNHNPSSLGRNWVPNSYSITRSHFSTSSSGNRYSLASNSAEEWVWGETGSTTATNQNTGGGQSHNNMPPYLAVYMWKRTG